MHDLLTLAQKAADRAGKAIISHYGQIAFELKKDQSPVTLADMAAHSIIKETLSESTIPILSEEDTAIILPPYPTRLWIVDPLDGTKGFLNRTDDFSVMIALLEYGRPVIAVVHAPVLKKQYYAIKNFGCFCIDSEGERPLRVSNRTTPDLRGLLSVNHRAPYMFDVLKSLQVTEHISIGSVGIKAGYIGESFADFYVNNGHLGEWDVCAPELILTEAGGNVTDADGDPLYYGNEGHRIKNGIVFSNGVCHEDVRKAFKQSTTTQKPV